MIAGKLQSCKAALLVVTALLLYARAICGIAKT